MQDILAEVQRDEKGKWLGISDRNRLEGRSSKSAAAGYGERKGAERGCSAEYRLHLT